MPIYNVFGKEVDGISRPIISRFATRRYDKGTGKLAYYQGCWEENDVYLPLLHTDKDGFDTRADITPNMILSPGTVLFRFGYAGGYFTSCVPDGWHVGDPMDYFVENYKHLCLPWKIETVEFHIYVVKEDTEVFAGVTDSGAIPATKLTDKQKSVTIGLVGDNWVVDESEIPNKYKEYFYAFADGKLAMKGGITQFKHELPIERLLRDGYLEEVALWQE